MALYLTQTKLSKYLLGLAMTLDHVKYIISYSYTAQNKTKQIYTLGVVRPSRRSENGDWGKRGANRIDSPWRKVWHPFVAFSENGEWRPRRWETRGMRWNFFENSPSSPAEQKKLGFAFSNNGPSAIQGEGATSPFSDLGEWEESPVTTPIVDRPSTGGILSLPTNEMCF